jgi:hypothetical protein
VPSAKLTVWNEAMYYFHVAPAQYKRRSSCCMTSGVGRGRAL